MGLFSRFKKSDSHSKKERSAKLIISNHELLSAESARITFAIPEQLKEAYTFVPGQYLNLHCDVDGSVKMRSYSICSGPNEPLSVAVKAIPSGRVSNWLLTVLMKGHDLIVDFPQGNFKLDPTKKKHVAFAAGSGITPIHSMAKSIEGTDQEMELYFSNSKPSTAIFVDELKTLSNTKTHFYFSREDVDGASKGRFDKETVSELIKADLTILRAEAFYICGPEEMIVAVKETLQVFGVNPEFIHYELFTVPVLLESQITEQGNEHFVGDSTVTAILDGEVVTVKLHTDGSSILDALDRKGMDVPYSCKGGVCCTCKAKLIEGTAKMTVNYALTDEEVKNGYILACQAHPTSEVVKLDFDV